MKQLFLILSLMLVPASIYGMEKSLKSELSVQDLIDRNQLPEIREGLLDLSEKKLTSLYGLQNIPNKDQIEFLFFPCNQIMDLKDDTFDSFVHLKELDLSNNPMPKLNFKALEKLTNLERLYLEGLNLVEIPANAFSTLTNLQDLILSHNRLKRLPNRILDPLSKLIVLDISDNDIDFLDPHLLQNQTELIALYIQNNKLQRLPRILHLSTLALLHLKGNRDIKELSPEEVAFILEHKIAIDTTKLIGDIQPYSIGQLIADLGENWRQELLLDDPTMPGSLELNLEQRGLTDLSDFPPELFTPALVKISAKYNYIKEIPVNFLNAAFSSYIHTIDFSDNKIKSLPINIPRFLENPNSILINLSKNKIKVIPPNIFANINVGILDLTDNKIHSIAETAFNGLTSLNILVLDRNKLHVLPKNVFKNLINLETLGLTNNKLGSKQQYAFPPNAKVDFCPQEIPMLKLVVAKKIVEEFEDKSLLDVTKIMQKLPTDLHEALFKAASDKALIKMSNALQIIRAMDLLREYQDIAETAVPSPETDMRKTLLFNRIKRHIKDFSADMKEVLLELELEKARDMLTQVGIGISTE